MFSQEDKHHNEYQYINWTWLNSLNMIDVMKETTSTYWAQVLYITVEIRELFFVRHACSKIAIAAKTGK